MTTAQAVQKDAETRMQGALDALGREFAGVRTGRANAALLEHVRVDYYDTPTPLSQIASVSVPDARTLMIQPWDQSVLTKIERAIQKSDLGLTPVNDGKVIRLTIPPLNEERRKQLAKSVGKLAEEARVAIRNVRREAKEKVKALLKDKKISEDDERRSETELQKLTDRSIAEGRRAPEEEGAGDPGVLTADSTGPAADAVAADEAALLEAIRQQPLPQHVAVIMDGNGRWAGLRGLPRVAGHREGVRAARETVRDGGPPRHRVPHALRVLLRELDPAAGRGELPHAAPRELGRRRSCRASSRTTSGCAPSESSPRSTRACGGASSAPSARPSATRGSRS